MVLWYTYISVFKLTCGSQSKMSCVLSFSITPSPTAFEQSLAELKGLWRLPRDLTLVLMLAEQVLLPTKQSPQASF